MSEVDGCACGFSGAAACVVGGAQARGSEGAEGVYVDYPPAELAKRYEFRYGAVFGRLIARR